MNIKRFLKPRVLLPILYISILLFFLVRQLISPENATCMGDYSVFCITDFETAFALASLPITLIILEVLNLMGRTDAGPSVPLYLCMFTLTISLYYFVGATLEKLDVKLRKPAH